jgi:hypothetical protein
VETFVSAPIVITSITVAGNNVEVNFTGPPEAAPGAFTLQSSATVNSGYADDGGAVITQVGPPGSFKAATTINGAERFYHVKY